MLFVLVNGAFHGSRGCTCTVSIWVPSRLRPIPIPILALKVPSARVVIFVLVLLAFYLPRRFKKWFSLQLRPTPSPPSLVPPVITPVYLKKADVSLKVKDSHKKEDEADNTILYWYHVALKLVQNITKMMMKPQQTLREYERETSKVLGPPGKYFIELTHLLEKRLYGKRQPDASDIQKSQELALELQKEAGSKK